MRQDPQSLTPPESGIRALALIFNALQPTNWLNNTCSCIYRGPVNQQDNSQRTWKLNNLDKK